MKRQLKFWLVFIGIGSILSCEKEQQKTLDLSQANIVISAQIKSPIQETAAPVMAKIPPNQKKKAIVFSIKKMATKIRYGLLLQINGAFFTV